LLRVIPLALNFEFTQESIKLGSQRHHMQKYTPRSGSK
jgi:hypothetical protein